MVDKVRTSLSLSLSLLSSASPYPLPLAMHRLSKWWNDKKLGHKRSNKRKESQQYVVLFQLLQRDIALLRGALTPRESSSLAIEYPQSTTSLETEEKEEELDISIPKGWRIEVYFEKQGENKSVEFWAEGEISKTTKKLFYVHIEGEECLVHVKKCEMDRWRIIV